MTTTEKTDTKTLADAKNLTNRSERKEEHIMTVPVVLKDGEEKNVSKDELQFLLVTSRVLFFERSNGWAVIGRDVMRDHVEPLAENDRRKHGVFAVAF